jgi:hypothetical protein
VSVGHCRRFAAGQELSSLTYRWDVFCCVCGNSCKGANVNYLNEEFEVMSGEEITKETTTEIKNIVKKLKWCNKFITLFSNNKNNKYNNYQVSCEDHLPFKDDDDYGIFMHYDCWKFVKITYGVELHYNNLPVNYIDISKKALLGAPPLMNIDYGEIKKYWSQDMEFYKMSTDKNTYMLESPLVTSNTKNINRIKKIVSQFKLKKELRPSPPISATFYKNNTIKLGNNNKFWIIKNNKWNQIKEDVIKKKINFDIKNKLLYKIMDTPRIGEYNSIPLFISNIKETKKEKTIEIIGVEESINNFEKKYIK